jgi:hypothetical protein
VCCQLRQAELEARLQEELGDGFCVNSDASTTGTEDSECLLYISMFPKFKEKFKCTRPEDPRGVG